MSEIQNYGKITATIGAASLIFNDYVIALTEIEGGHRLTATRGSEVQAIDVMDGRTLNPRGAWDAAAKYAQYDTVSHNQGAYVALQPSQGVEPAPGAYWAVLVDNAEAVRATEAALEAAKRADAAEAERAGAEQARVENETARAAAERVRAENEAVRAEAENGRVTAEDGRSNAESARVSAEQGRVAAEQNRQSAEQERSAAESARTEAEQGRANAEAERAEAETERANAENARVQAEQGRAAAENSRVSAEAGRAEAEAARVQAEALRVEAETARAAEMEEMAAEVNAAVEAAQELIQDDVIAGGSTWSSKQIIDAICPPLEETGNPVQCYPVAGYPLGVKASWEPRQEGEGDPSPDNVRPIVGLDEVQVTLSGGVSDGTTATLNLPSTVYGGEVDLATGEGVETVHGIVLDGTETWSEYNSGSTGLKYFQYTVSDAQRLPSAGGSSILAKSSQKISHFSIGNPYSEIVDNAGWVYSTRAADYYGIRIRMSACADVDEWKSYLAAQYAAGTPVTIAYKLATPQPIQATGSQSLPALSGENVPITNADSLTVTGRADPTHTIQTLSDRIAALESETIEGGTNA